MVPPRKEGFGRDDRAESSDRSLGGDASEEFTEIDGSGSSGHQGTTRTAGGLADRLSDVLRGESDGDLFLGRSDAENGVLQWLRALDLQVLGACRADERLRPLLKLNVSTGAAEDRLITQLSQVRMNLHGFSCATSNSHRSYSPQFSLNKSSHLSFSGLNILLWLFFVHIFFLCQLTASVSVIFSI